MAARKPGKDWLVFSLFGHEWEARVVRATSKALDGAVAITYFDAHVMYFSDKCSPEQMRTGLAHEIQHVVEEQADVDYAVAVTNEDVADRMTDQVARGWLYVIRHCPEVVAVLQGGDVMVEV